jgi:sulfatase modifying factor 1
MRSKLFLVALVAFSACDKNHSLGVLDPELGSGSSGGQSAAGLGGATGSGGAMVSGSPARPSCAGLAATCGPSGNEDCCTSLLVPGGTYYRSYDGVTYTDKSYPATVSNFHLDKYEVTVGRFPAVSWTREWETQTSPPKAGAGSHPLISGSGWNPQWNASLSANTAALKAAMTCNYPTWTDTSGSNENRPINCLDWFTASAFCAWDGGTAGNRGGMELRGRGRQ